jgi:hypothetical protein
MLLLNTFLVVHAAIRGWLLLYTTNMQTTISSHNTVAVITHADSSFA